MVVITVSHCPPGAGPGGSGVEASLENEGDDHAGIGMAPPHRKLESSTGFMDVGSQPPRQPPLSYRAIPLSRSMPVLSLFLASLVLLTMTTPPGFL